MNAEYHYLLSPQRNFVSKASRLLVQPTVSGDGLQIATCEVIAEGFKSSTLRRWVKNPDPENLRESEL